MRVAGSSVGERGEIEQRVERRVPAADDEHATAGVAGTLGAKDVRNAVEHVRSRRLFTNRAHA